MYAIVEILGQQFKVTAGQKLYVHRMEEVQIGAELEFDKVLLIENEGNISVGVPVVAGAKVVVEVKAHVKGDKVLVFKKIRKDDYQKMNGHRQYFTELFIKEIVA